MSEEGLRKTHSRGCPKRRGISPIMAGKLYDDATPYGHNWTYPLVSLLPPETETDIRSQLLCRKPIDDLR